MAITKRLAAGVVTAKSDPITGGIVSLLNNNDRLGLPGAIPNGMDWMSDTLHGFDIYSKGLVKTPTLFFDPTATSSAGRGTYRNPYTTQAELMAAIKGDMAGHVVGFKRGTTLRVTGTNGLQLTLHGSADAPVVLCPYGDAEALPIISGGAVITSWTLVDAGANIWSYVIGATEHDVWQDDVRLWKKTWSTSAVNTLTEEGDSTYNSSTLYIRPYNGENPNFGQIEVSVVDNTVRLLYSDVATTGNIWLTGLSVTKARNSNLSIVRSGITTISDCDNIIVAGVKCSGAGVDNTQGLGRDAILFWGPSDAIRATGVQIVGNYCVDALNNPIEVSNTDGAIIELNNGYNYSGNGIELWASNQNSLTRYNKMELGTSKEPGGTRTRIQSGLGGGGYWLNNLVGDTETADTSNSKNSGNVCAFNLFKNTRIRAIYLSGGGGTGNKVHHNTCVFDDTVTGYGTTASASGWFMKDPGFAVPNGWVDISNNLFFWKDTATRYPNLVRSNVPLGANAAVPTGNNNIYMHSNAAPNGNFYFKSSFSGADSTASFTTYKTTLSAYSLDQNSLCTSAQGGGTLTISNLNFDTDTDAPGAGSAALAAGLTTLTGIGTRYHDGVPYVAATCSIGAFLGG